MTITHYDEFSGIGGFSDAARFVPNVECTDAANHDPDACAQHALNFPGARHYQADVTKLDMLKMPRVDLFTGSPACPSWTTANGMKRDFDKTNAIQDALFDMPGADPRDPAVKRRAKQYKRARLLMWEPIVYLRAVLERTPAQPVLIGVIENVVQCRLWADWDAWIGEFHKLGYRTKLIAYNAMHARPVRAPWSPQSRNRLFLGFWHQSIGRDPDWNKWLRPRAWCDKCCQVVDAVHVFKDPTRDMGLYDTQYIYQCPNHRCAGNRVHPEAVAALAAIDLARRGVRIGDREKLGMKPLADATAARIEAGKRRHWGPLLVPCGGTWRGDGDRGAVPLSRPAPARTTRETDGIAVPPLLVPVEARAELGRAATAAEPARTMTTRNETGVAALPFIASLRGGGCKNATKSVTEPAGTVTASGNHHGLAVPPALITRMNNSGGQEQGHLSTPVTEPARTVTANGKQALITLADALLVPYYGTAEAARPASEPCGTITTVERYGIAAPDGAYLAELPALEDIEFRMLDDDEIGRLMGFGPHFRNEAPSKRTRVRLYGNAVCPSVGEIIISALVECMTGEDLPRELAVAA